MINITTVQNDEGDGDLGLDCKSFLELVEILSFRTLIKSIYAIAKVIFFFNKLLTAVTLSEKAAYPLHVLSTRSPG